MSDVLRLKEQLHQVSMEAKQAAGGLAGFKLRFTQHSQLVESSDIWNSSSPALSS